MANIKLFTKVVKKYSTLDSFRSKSLRDDRPQALRHSCHRPICLLKWILISISQKRKINLHLVDHVLGHFQGSTAIKTVPLQVLLTPICKHHEQKISPICLHLTFMVLAFNASSAIALKSFHLNSCKKGFKSILVDRQMVK